MTLKNHKTLMTINLLLRDHQAVVPAYARVCQRQQHDKLEVPHAPGSILPFRLHLRTRHPRQAGGPSFPEALLLHQFRRNQLSLLLADDATTFRTLTNSQLRGRTRAPILSPIGPCPSQPSPERQKRRILLCLTSRLQLQQQNRQPRRRQHRWASLGRIHRGGMYQLTIKGKTQPQHPHPLQTPNLKRSPHVRRRFSLL